MKSKELIHVIAVDAVIACFIIVTYGVCGLSFQDTSTLRQALAITLAPVYLIIFFWFNYKYLLKSKLTLSEICDKDNLAYMIQRYYKEGRGVLDKQILLTKGHISRFEREKECLKNILYENFKEDSQLSSMNNLMDNAEETFTTNVRQIIKRISIFDFKEYEIFSKSSSDTGLTLENYKKKELQFKEHINYVSNLCNKNEELLLELNNLITEVSRMNDSEKENNLSEIYSICKYKWRNNLCWCAR